MHENTFCSEWKVLKESIRGIDVMNNLYLPYFIELLHGNTWRAAYHTTYMSQIWAFSHISRSSQYKCDSQMV